jgi:hypothetical protein
MRFVRRLRLRLAPLAFLAVMAVLVLIIAWTDRGLERHLRATDDQVELVYLPPTRFLQAVSLGYRHALADILWFRTISYFGRHYRSDRIYPWLAYMCEVVTDLDPQAQHVYRFGGLLLPWEAGRVDEGIALLQKGTRNMPGSWELSYMLGFSYYFFQDDLAAATKELQRAAVLPHAPLFVTRLAAVIDAAHQGPERAIEFLSELERRGTNGEIHGAIRERIRELLLARDIDTLEAAVGTFRGTFERLPLDLEDLVSTGVLTAIPPEPFGGRYVLDPSTGHVHSSTGRKPARLGSSKMRQSFLEKRHPGD